MCHGRGHVRASFALPLSAPISQQNAVGGSPVARQCDAWLMKRKLKTLALSELQHREGHDHPHVVNRHQNRLQGYPCSRILSRR